MPRIRIGVVGAGRFAPAHLRAYAARVDVELVAIANRTLERAAALAREFGISRVYESAEAMIDDTAPDAISVVTAPTAHEATVAFALERGVAALVEKPMGGHVATAERLAETAERTGTPLLAGHILRFSEPHRRLVEDIHRGTLGLLLAVAARRDRSSAIAKSYGIHPALLTAIHDIDLILWLSRSRVERVSALEIALPALSAPVGIWAQLTLSDATIASVTSTLLHDQSSPETISDRLDAYCSEGVASLESTDARIRVESAHHRSLSQATLTPLDGRGAMGAEIAHFVQLIVERRQSSIVPLADVVHGIRVAHSMIQSAYNAGEFVKC